MVRMATPLSETSTRGDTTTRLTSSTRRFARDDRVGTEINVILQPLIAEMYLPWPSSRSS